MAEFWRALRPPQALQAEQALATGPAPAPCTLLEIIVRRPTVRPPLVHRPQPDEPERNAGSRLDHVMPDLSTPGHTLHERAPWMPNEPEPGRDRRGRGVVPARGRAASALERTRRPQATLNTGERPQQTTAAPRARPPLPRDRPLRLIQRRAARSDLGSQRSRNRLRRDVLAGAADSPHNSQPKAFDGFHERMINAIPAARLLAP
jgi:hypothetical protein